MEKASPANRLIAAIIDGVILFVVNFVLGLVFGFLGDAGATLGSLLTLIVDIGYFVYFWSSTGQTPGKKMMGIKVVTTGGGKLDMGKAVIRYIGYLISAAVVFLGFLWILFDKDKQGWHDKIAGTFVVKA